MALHGHHQSNFLIYCRKQIQKPVAGQCVESKRHWDTYSSMGCLNQFLFTQDSGDLTERGGRMILRANEDKGY